MDYELLDSGDGRRLERFGGYVLDRPDPEVIWSKSLSEAEWKKADAKFMRAERDKGNWVKNISIPEKWQMSQQNISFWVKLTPFKHTGFFPEQVGQWENIYDKIKTQKAKVKILNLFAYTGIATLFAADAGAAVTHVDASRPAISWARENQEASGLTQKPIRWILDDAIKFVEREIKRGNRYDAIVMDPPVYGHGPTGKVWEFSKDFPMLLNSCKKLLSDNPLFVLVNAYAVSTSPTSLANILQGTFGDLGGTVEHGELTLKEESAGRLLSTGIWARWSK